MAPLRILQGLLVSALLLIPLAGASSQGDSTYDEACPDIVRTALAATDEVCDPTGLNQACYGHILVDAYPQAGVDSLVFNYPGDIVNLLELQSLRLSAMDPESGIWGISLLNLLAHMPYASPQQVTFLLFGDVEVENAVAAPALVDVTVAVGEYVNVRLGPATYVGSVATLAPGQTVTANGRLADSSWLRIALPDSGRAGWIWAELVTAAGDIETLAVVERWAPYYGPMQAFILRSGAGDALCPQAPESGLMIQTPEGLAEVILLINEVQIRLRATAFVQALPGGAMTIDVLDGWVEVDVFGGQQFAPAGSQVSIPLDEWMAPTGPPRLPVPYDQERLQSLPVQNFNQVVVIPPPIRYDELMSQGEDLNSQGAPPEQAGTGSDMGEAPVVQNETPPTEQNNTPQDDSASGSDDGGSDGGGTDGGGSDGGGSDDGGSDGGESDSGGSDDGGSDGGGSDDGGHVPPGQGGTPPGLVDNPALGDDGPPGQGSTPPGQR